MNYLGHAFLSIKDESILTGNMIGDYVKGMQALQDYPEAVQRGIMLHRKIDSFTDVHPAVTRAKLYFRETYHLYAGAIVDIIFDHFLANDPKHFASEKVLLQFTEETYYSLDKYQQYFPDKFVELFPYMRSNNWLYNYRTLQGIQKSLRGLYHRAKQMPDIDEAYKIFVGHYYQLNQCYFELIDDILSYVKVELSDH